MQIVSNFDYSRSTFELRRTLPLPCGQRRLELERYPSNLAGVPARICIIHHCSPERSVVERSEATVQLRLTGQLSAR
jgi:hypothetical protein